MNSQGSISKNNRKLVAGAAFVVAVKVCDPPEMRLKEIIEVQMKTYHKFSVRLGFNSVKYLEVHINRFIEDSKAFAQSVRAVNIHTFTL